jgi:hypothetical protein
MPPTAADHEPADHLNDEPPPGRIRHEPSPGIDETKPRGAESRPLGPSRAAMTARLKRIRQKLRQQRREDG